MFKGRKIVDWMNYKPITLDIDNFTGDLKETDLLTAFKNSDQQTR